jgi:hypothetical protein
VWLMLAVLLGSGRGRPPAVVGTRAR